MRGFSSFVVSAIVAANASAEEQTDNAYYYASPYASHEPYYGEPVYAEPRYIQEPRYVQEPLYREPHYAQPRYVEVEQLLFQR